MGSQTESILLKNAVLCLEGRDFDNALPLLHKARGLNPDNPDILRLLAVIAAMKFDYIDALKGIDECLNLAPNNGIAHSNRGNILKELGRHEEALIAFDIAIELLPAYAEAYCNKGNVLQELYRYEDALNWYDKAIALQPSYAEAYSNKGNALGLLHRHKEAMQCYDKATAINPEYVDAYWHKALSQLPDGEFQSGWENYEARWFKSHAAKLLYSQIPRLESLKDLSGKRILIWSEQGFGDSIQFCRYIKLLSDQGAEVTFVVPNPLMNVLSSLKAYCILVSTVDNQAQFDYQSPLLSLPLVFGTTLESIPVQSPYLFSNPENRKAFEEQFKKTQNLKVGVIWNGGFRAEHPELWAVNKRRNIDLEQISKLKDTPGVDFYSLQKGEPAEAQFLARKDELWPNIVNCAPLLNDFSDTAALMECLDLIISVDTSSAHLAGALGRSVWILNRYDSCWRWLRGRTDSPWYPTATIYQQTAPGDWDGVIEKVKSDLGVLAKSHLLR